MAKNTTEVVKTDNSIPGFLKNNTTSRGSENIDHNDLSIPRIEIVQSLSTVRKKNSAEYIEGAEEGMLYNSVTKELYGFEINFVPVYFIKQYLVWRDRKLGSGFGGAYQTEEEAIYRVREMENPNEWESVLTHQHFGLVVKENGEKEEVVVSMAKSKIRVSKKLNSLIRINGNDRFSRIYKIKGVQVENNQNQEFFNFDFVNVGFVTEDIYRHAEKVYELLKSGSASVNYESEEGESTTDDDAPF